MRLKSSYRPKHYKDGGAVPLEAKVVDSEPMDKTVASIDVDHGDDTASSAFKGQIDALRKAEDTQRQRAADLTTEQKYADHVREVTEHIKGHPDMIRHPQILAAAADEVGRGDHGLAVHSLPFFDLVKANFENRMRNEPPEQAPEPEEPVKPRRKPEVDDEVESMNERVRRGGGRVPSAWLERSVPDGRSYNVRSGRVTLSIEQKDMARRLGQSEVEYAKGLLEMRKRDEEYGR
jgi:hypothetical protein